jgi:hypothetical protein
MIDWQLILVLFLASVVSSVVSSVLSTLFNRKWPICDINMMSHMYMTIVFDFIIGCSLFGLVLWFNSDVPTLQGQAMSAFLGIASYALMLLIIDVGKYNKLRKSLEILNIDSNEKLEQYIREQEQR